MKLHSELVLGGLFLTAADGSPPGLWDYQSLICVQDWFKMICLSLACSCLVCSVILTAYLGR